MGLTSFVAARDRLLAATTPTVDCEDACAQVMRAFADVAPFQAAAVMTTDPESHLPAGGVVTGFSPGDCVPFWDNELLDPDFNKFNDLARRPDPVATLVEATDGDLARSPRHAKLYAPSDAVDELRVVFVAGSSCVAIGAFVRTLGGPFTPTEVRDVRALLVPATSLFRRALGNITAPLAGDAPAVLLVDANGRIVSRSADAAGVLADLRIEIDDDVPGTLLVAAAKARAARTTARLTTRLRGRSGRWVRVHVSPMDGDGDLVGITISAAQPSDLVPILLESYGLTERETDVALLVCQGLATKEIAHELSISSHTVRDHLKEIFEKTGAHTRGELVAQIFSHHVLGAFHESVVELER